MSTTFGSIGTSLTQSGNRMTKGVADSFAQGNAYASVPIQAGDKVYWEVKVSGSIHMMTGVVCTDSSPSGITYQDTYAATQSNAYTAYYNNGTNQLLIFGEGVQKDTINSGSFTLSDTDIFGCTYDYDNQILSMYRNNVFQGSVDFTDYGEASRSVDMHIVLSLFNNGSWAEIYTNSADQTYSPPADFAALEGTASATTYTPQSSVMTIDEVALFSDVLTLEEVAALYSFVGNNIPVHVYDGTNMLSVPSIKVHDGTVKDVTTVAVWT